MIRKSIAAFFLLCTLVPWTGVPNAASRKEPSVAHGRLVWAFQAVISRHNNDLQRFLNEGLVDYYKKDATNYSTRIGAFRMPGCK